MLEEEFKTVIPSLLDYSRADKQPDYVCNVLYTLILNSYDNYYRIEEKYIEQLVVDYLLDPEIKDLIR